MGPMTAAWQRQVAWRWAYLILLAALGLGSAAALLDCHSAERNLLHGHLVLGALGPDRARALASHDHAHEQLHTHNPSTGQPRPADAGYRLKATDVQVVAVGDRLGLGPSVFEMGGQALPGPARLGPFGPGQSHRLSPLAPPLSGVAIPVPQPPPRG